MAFFRSVAALSKLRSRVGQQSNLCNSVRWIQMQSSTELDLHSQLKELIPEQRERLKKLETEHGEVELEKITVDMVLGGMRGMTGLLSETSLLDPDEGIRFRGLSIPECQKVLPAAKPDGEPLPEGLLWLLLTGKVPSKQQVDALTKELQNRATVPDYAYRAIDALPTTATPMQMFTTGVEAMQVESEFLKAYKKGNQRIVFRSWEPTYEDSLNLIARVPLLASYVYRRIYKDGKIISKDDSLDYGGNFSHMLGFDSPQMLEFMRLYLTIHSDRKDRNIFGNTDFLVGRALTDPYLSFSKALNALTLPPRGFNNERVLFWIKSVVDEYGENITTEQLKDYVRKALNKGKIQRYRLENMRIDQVKYFNRFELIMKAFLTLLFTKFVPGCERGVLNKTDPLYMCQREFALKHLPEDPLFQLFSKLNDVAPPIRTELGMGPYSWGYFEKAHSGVLFNHFGLTEATYFNVLSGVSWSLGIGSQLIWKRALGLPLKMRSLNSSMTSATRRLDIRY